MRARKGREKVQSGRTRGRSAAAAAAAAALPRCVARSLNKDGGRGLEGRPVRSGAAYLVGRQEQLQRPGHPGGMDAEEAGVGAARDAGLRRRRHQGRARRRGRGGDRGDRQTRARREGRHTEDESAQVRQGRGHGGAYLSQRGLRSA